MQCREYLEAFSFSRDCAHQQGRCAASETHRRQARWPPRGARLPLMPRQLNSKFQSDPSSQTRGKSIAVSRKPSSWQVLEVVKLVCKRYLYLSSPAGTTFGWPHLSSSRDFPLACSSFRHHRWQTPVANDLTFILVTDPTSLANLLFEADGTQAPAHPCRATLP